jgi:hypothetical protein
VKVYSRVILGVIAAAVVFGAAWSAAHRFYVAPRRTTVDRIESLRGTLDQFNGERRELARMQDEMQAVADRTLGSERQTVEMALRTRLNRIGEELGLSGASVSTTTATGRESPARRSLHRNNPFRDAIDFVEVEASIAGEGSLEQAMRLVHRVQQEPWLKRIDAFSIDPRDDGLTVRTTVRLTTMFVPDFQPSFDAAPSAPADDGSFERYAVFAAANPFQVPPPVAVETQAVVQESPDPPPAPRNPPYDYGQWLLTALTEGSRGSEAWLLNRKTSETRTLAVSERLKQMEFLGASEAGAAFRVGDEYVSIAIGSSLNARTPMTASERTAVVRDGSDGAGTTEESGGSHDDQD